MGFRIEPVGGPQSGTIDHVSVGGRDGFGPGQVGIHPPAGFDEWAPGAAKGRIKGVQDHGNMGGRRNGHRIPVRGVFQDDGPVKCPAGIEFEQERPGRPAERESRQRRRMGGRDRKVIFPADIVRGGPVRREALQAAGKAQEKRSVRRARGGRGRDEKKAGGKETHSHDKDYTTTAGVPCRLPPP